MKGGLRLPPACLCTLRSCPDFLGEGYGLTSAVDTWTLLILAARERLAWNSAWQD